MTATSLHVPKPSTIAKSQSLKLASDTPPSKRAHRLSDTRIIPEELDSSDDEPDEVSALQSSVELGVDVSRLGVADAGRASRKMSEEPRSQEERAQLLSDRAKHGMRVSAI